MAQTKVKLISDGVIVQSNLHASHGITTAHIGEGSNLYYTDARSRAAISVSGNALSYNSSTGVITSNFEESPTFTGDVLIGTSTTTPSTHYNNLVIEDVAGNNVGISLISGTGNNTALYFGDSADTDVAQLKYSHATNTMFFVVNASEAMRIDSSGNVGIGTTSPYSNLQVTGTLKIATGNAQGILGLGEGNGTTVNVGIWRGAVNNPTSDGNYLNLGGYDGIILATGNAAIGSQTERLRIDSSGNVGIGTTSPSHELHVVSAGNGEIKAERTSGAAILTQAQSALGRFGTTTNHNLQFMTNSAGVMTITTAQNVGIGTSSPNHKLDIYSNENVPLRIHRPSNANLNSSGAWGIGFSTRGDAINSTTDTRAGIFSYYNGNLFFATNTSSVVADPDGSARMTILSTGYVGINTTNPLNQFDVRGAVYVTGYTVGFDTSPQGNYAYRLTNDGGNSFINIQGGNLGIGLTSPAVKLEIQDSTHTTMKIKSGNNDNILFLQALQSDEARIGTDTNSAISFFTNTSRRMTITTSGLVGIGTNLPSRELDIQAASGWAEIALRGQSGAGGSLEFWTTTTKRAEIFADTEDIVFRNTASNTERMRIDSNGVLQLTTTSSHGFVNANGTSLELDVNRHPETGAFSDTGKSHARINLTGVSGGSYIIFNTASANNTTASERMRVTSNGITFNGDTAAANALDDYEEGTFTPAIGDGTYSYSYRRGHYQKIGNTVHIHIGFKINQASSVGTGVARITGLPFAGMGWGSYQEPHERCGVAGLCVTANLSYNLSFYVSNSSAQLNGRTSANNADTQVNSNQVWQNGTFIKLQLSYTVS